MSAANKGWIWVDQAVLVAVHDEQLAEHGGPSGTRDLTLLESALARPRQRASYGTPDAADLAASLGFGIARNHPFVDGNKRTAFVAAELFLVLNDLALDASDADCVLTMLAVAAGEMEEEAFATWIRARIVKA
ncbi:type II toxin-antitoxin system death-on-curing family toxin [Pelomonas sp. KK5]|uniref:type II toxin-antitoxin system death-on-curing family toxin n=1 Tax=Pelomonas sp. KK5 TaxID=1855730 RepID=UPI00097BC8B8|nr:type II toxin-antitoxin system death-on-curing family toxin [Pelomonas sp. KK5]